MISIWSAIALSKESANIPQKKSRKTAIGFQGQTASSPSRRSDWCLPATSSILLILLAFGFAGSLIFELSNRVRGIDDQQAILDDISQAELLEE